MAKMRFRRDTSEIDQAFARLKESENQKQAEEDRRKAEVKAEEERRFRSITAKFVETLEATLRRLAKLSETPREALAEFRKVADVKALKQENVRNFLARAEGREIYGFELIFTDKSRYLLFFQHCSSFEPYHPFSAKMIQYPRFPRRADAESKADERIAVTASKVFCYGNSQRGIVRVLSDALHSDVSCAVETVVNIRIKGIQEEGYLQQALCRIQKMGFLSDPQKRTGKSLPRYDKRNFFQRSAWDDSHGADYILSYVPKDYEYRTMKLQLKSNVDDLKAHTKRFASIPCIVSPRGLCGVYPRPVEKIMVLQEMTLLAMTAYAQDVVLQLSEDPVVLALMGLMKNGAIVKVEREVRECHDHGHHWGHKQCLWYRVFLPSGERIGFAAFADDWRSRKRFFNRDHPNAPFVVMRALKDEGAVLQDLKDQILRILPVEPAQPQENVSHAS